MTTPSTFRILAHLWITSAFFALAFDPLGVVYEAAHLARRDFGGSAPAVVDTGDTERPFGVDGDTFTDYDSAAQRSCNIQFDNCQRAANGDSSVSFSVVDCSNQQNVCLVDPPSAEEPSTSMTATEDENSDTTESESGLGSIVQTAIPYDSEYDLVCDL
ncbi:hypothetical protein BDW59DRAFT_30847 [Aspergillus cavernicola]|uniref:Uncharacterized protein n=1 Tax=Aspergillus cavernicola TaxID=176166 RepID=A0ABR4HDF3_9EURO